MSTSTHATATIRTFHLWLLTNLGGTGLLVMDFCRDSATDIAVPLLIGFVAALLSLVAVPLAIPFFALAQRQCIGWHCRLVALAVVIIGFCAANYLLFSLLPLGSLNNILSMSQPYLGAALLALAWLYRPQPALQPVRLTTTKPQGAAPQGRFNWSGLV
jgi:hypothetical protein